MKLIFSLLIVASTYFSWTQIQFEHTTLEKAIELAKKNKKPLFVDVYATWCGPCKMMAATAFTDSAVAKLYNDKFINLKLDGEKNDGPDVMRMYSISAYPTLLYFNEKGVLVEKVVGAMDKFQLINKGKMILNPETNPIFIAAKKYHQSHRTQADLGQYISILNENNHDSLQKYCDLYFLKYPNLNLDVPEEFTVFMHSVHDYKHPLSVQFIEGERYILNKEVYLEKLNDYFKSTYEATKAANDFESMKIMVEKLYPYLQKAEVPDLFPLDQLLQNIQESF